MKGRIAPESVLVAIDVGTTKICVLIAHQTGPDECEIIGVGKAPSHGMARGVVVDIAPAVDAIRTAVREAELMAGLTVESAYVGISGSHIHATNSQGMIPIKHGVIRPHDVEQVVNVARAVPLPEGQQILHVLPQYFVVDGGQRVQDPVNMHGVRLEAYVHIITGGVSSVQNLVRCAELAGVTVRDVVLEPLASAQAVLSADERELGVALLDIGGGTADFAVYQQGNIRHTKIIPVAGMMFTNDLALCLRTTLSDAERIKKEYGMCHRGLLTNDQAIEIEQVQGGSYQHVMHSEVIEILASRAEELFTLLGNEITQFHVAQFMPAGIVLTGGGALLSGMDQVAQEMLGMPARVGRPRGAMALKTLFEHPMYATAYGLVLYALRNNRSNGLQHINGPLMNKVFSRMKAWVMDFF